jgi:protein-S-isoprenylcysteine O-methyltransferase Ste14
MTLQFAASLELILCWAVWVYIPIFRAPHGQQRPSITVKGRTLAGLALEMAGFILSGLIREPVVVGWPRLAASMIAAPLGVLVMWPAVAHLGRQFRINAGLYEDHKLVRTGPYAIIRHPIYASMLLMLTANAMLFTRAVWIPVALALYIAGTEIRVRTEDALLASRFGPQFDDYRRQVSAYIPFVR